MTVRTTLAPAKINLFLHVGAVDGDGYHPLSSLVVFADVGDRVSVEAAGELSLDVVGPFAVSLSDQDDNLILRALRRLGEACGIGEPKLKVTLGKHLPIAAGLGGGSSDAGAALKLARDVLAIDLDDAALEAVAGVVGADGPMCLRMRTAWAEGRGDVLTDEPRLPPLPAVLFNPGVPSPTGAVYQAYDAGVVRSANRPAPLTDWSVEAAIDWLSVQRNDLEAPAVSLTPAIADALRAVADTPDVALTRMSGSGATVFGLYRTDAAAKAAAAILAQIHPAAWIRPTCLAGS
ncbi:MAG: 4-(cytidine 5'-diphospho)-2-C-methyl-D-erythritol kinase [Pseudomonadota bacterium]